MSKHAQKLNQMHQTHHGFTLIEILVAVLILSLGVVGLIGMESLALKSNLSAYHRSQATILAYDLADKMRSNLDRSNEQTISASIASYVDSFPAKGVAHTNACVSFSGAVTGSGCDPQKIAERDVFEWFQKLDAVLPNGAGSLAPSSGVQPILTVTLSWDEELKDESPRKTFVFSFGL